MIIIDNYVFKSWFTSGPQLVILLNRNIQGYTPGGGEGGGYSILRHGREVFRGDDPRFWDFQSNWVPIVYLITI